jgi:hypothetical protein
MGVTRTAREPFIVINTKVFKEMFIGSYTSPGVNLK